MNGALSVEQIVKAQHYVPVFYLKNFTDSSGKLQVYDRVEQKFLSPFPKNICCSRFLYETPWEDTKVNLGKHVLCNNIEKKFSEYESDYSALIRRLLNICDPSKNRNALICSHADREKLISLVVNLFVRNPWAMEFFEMNNIPEGLNSHPLTIAIRELMDAMGFGGADSLMKHSVKWADLLEHEEGGLVEDLKQEIAKLNFTFYYSSTGNFITSSCPSCFGYLKNGQAAVHLPLSPHVIVWFGQNIVPRTVNNRMQIINADAAMRINNIYFSFDVKRVRYLIGNSTSTLQEYLP